MAMDPIISVRDVTVRFGSRAVLDGLNLDIRRGEILGFVGASGAGKSVLLRTIIGLVPRHSGTITVMGTDMDRADAAARRGVERRWGVLFQHGALFSSLSVRQNIQFPVREYLKLSDRLLDEITMAKLAMVGLEAGGGGAFSVGTVRRHDQAWWRWRGRLRSIRTSSSSTSRPPGLDPIGAGEFDELVRTLQRTLGLTVFMVTHDLDSLHTACDRIAVLGDGKVIAIGTMNDMLASHHPWLRAYFHWRACALWLYLRFSCILGVRVWRRGRITS